MKENAKQHVISCERRANSVMELMCPFCGDNWSVVRKWQWAARGRGSGGCNGSGGCIRGRGIRFRVVDVWRNIRRISSGTGWNKVGYIMCQNQVRMFSVWPKAPVGLERCVCRHSAGWIMRRSILYAHRCYNKIISVWDQQCRKLNKSEWDLRCSCVKPLTKTHTE